MPHILLPVLLLFSLFNGFFGRTVKKNLSTSNMRAENHISYENENVSANFDFESDECQNFICSRIYKPVCASVDAVRVTLPTFCHFMSKRRCYSQKQYTGEKVPVLRLMHAGSCYENEYNQNDNNQDQDMMGIRLLRKNNNRIRIFNR